MMTFTKRKKYALNPSGQAGVQNTSAMWCAMILDPFGRACVKYCCRTQKNARCVKSNARRWAVSWEAWSLTKPVHVQHVVMKTVLFVNTVKRTPSTVMKPGTFLHAHVHMRVHMRICVCCVLCDQCMLCVCKCVHSRMCVCACTCTHALTHAHMPVLTAPFPTKCLN